MGVGSRKEVKAILKEKRVTVNNKMVRNGNTQINPENDIVQLDGNEITYQKYAYLMLHKPAGVLSATRDDRQRTVLDLIGSDYAHYPLFPVGRLDKDTEGLLLITNDGDLAHQLLSPKKNVEKTYYAKIQGKVTDKDVAEFKDGIDIGEGIITKPADLTILTSRAISEIELTVTEGKFHQVKRMFEAVGKKVIYLNRIRMGEIILDPRLRKGKYRPLTEEELAYCEEVKNGKQGGQ